MEPECLNVDRTIDAYAALYERRDIDGLVSLLDPSARGFGTGADEVAEDPLDFRQAVARDFAQTESASVEFTERRCTVSGDIAWVMGNCRFSFRADGAETALDGRFTAVLRAQDGIWRFAQFHFSVPFAGQAPGSSWPRTS
ncbi:MAG: nuclear transport factor 2 family protein [Methanospirillum sp.]